MCGASDNRGAADVWRTRHLRHTKAPHPDPLPTTGEGIRRERNWEERELGGNGEWIAVFWIGEGSDRALGCFDRFEEEDGHIARVITYYYCPDTLREIAAELGVRALPQGASRGGYHQAPEVLSGMIRSAVLPWASTSTASR